MNKLLEENHHKLLHQSLIKTSKIHRKVCGQRFHELGLTEGQPKVLNYLHQHNGCSQKDLAKHCHIQPATMTSLLGNLEKGELIYREVNQEDRRVTNVFLTEKGFEFQQRVKEVFAQIDERCFAGFSEDERNEVLQYLDRIYHNLKEGES